MEAILGEVKRHTTEQCKISDSHIIFAVGMCAGDDINITSAELQSDLTLNC
jgi:hypothetical protein